ncbi:MAG TPA: hypothetical protein ENJ62_04110 [Bryobacterales bacterium]|nr:hypothetical protein [Bryobacterales bacterium]
MSETKELTLYQIEDDLRALLDTEEGMEPDDENRLQILREIAEKSQQAIEKRDNVIRFLRHLEMQLEAVDREIERLKSLKQSWLAGKEKVERYVAKVIEECVPEPKRGQRKLEGTVGVLTLRKAPDRVEVTDVAALPDAYVDVTITMRGTIYKKLLQQVDFVCEETEMPDVKTLDREMYAALREPKLQPRKRDVKQAIQRGEEIPGADIVFGENRLVVR